MMKYLSLALVFTFVACSAYSDDDTQDDDSPGEGYYTYPEPAAGDWSGSFFLESAAGDCEVETSEGPLSTTLSITQDTINEFLLEMSVPSLFVLPQDQADGLGNRISFACESGTYVEMFRTFECTGASASTTSTVSHTLSGVFTYWEVEIAFEWVAFTGTWEMDFDPQSTSGSENGVGTAQTETGCTIVGTLDMMWDGCQNEGVECLDATLPVTADD